MSDADRVIDVDAEEGVSGLIHRRRGERGVSDADRVIGVDAEEGGLRGAIDRERRGTYEMRA